MSSSPNLNVTLGTVGGTPIVANLDGAGFLQKQTVTIGSTAYVRDPPGDWPDANTGVYIKTSLTAFPQTLAPGTVVQLFKEEAAALIAAGAAS
jgi:hypothetical protein